PRGRADVVLTPHAGELARMLGAERAEVEARPLAHARRAAQAYGCVVLLKGHHTLVVHPDGPVRVTTTGNPWLASAGAGDVLGGVIGALAAAGLTPYDAASVGSWLHGAAATQVSQGGPIVAGDVARTLPRVVAAVLARAEMEGSEV
ncbi:MAG: ADP/ATP-dependent (S)-NAD(P)H-hydrate dehydratase, partial [Nocardioides sp.]